jgi:hypothetical protein
MVGLDRQLKNLPALLNTLLLDEGLAVLHAIITKHSFMPLGTPDWMIDEKVDAVFITLVFHVNDYIRDNTEINKRCSLQSRLKLKKAPNVWRSIPDTCGGLASVLLGLLEAHGRQGGRLRSGQSWAILPTPGAWEAG